MSEQYEDIDLHHDEMLTEAPVISASEIRVPAAKEFEEGTDYLPAPDALLRAHVLIERHKERFAFLAENDFTFDVMWKAKGASSRGRVTLGTCSLLGKGLIGHYSGLEFLILLNADHIRDRAFSDRQIEALIYHEMLHMGVTEKGKPGLYGHDMEEFRAVVEEYGLWKSDVAAMGDSFKQLGMSWFESRV